MIKEQKEPTGRVGSFLLYAKPFQTACANYFLCDKQLLDVKDKIPLRVRKRTWQSIIGTARHSVMKG